MNEDYDYVLDFWFGDAFDDLQVIREKSNLWWGKSAETDQLIWAKFEHRVEQACAGGLQDWRRQPQGRLAGIILVDQFCRNIYRDQPRAFAADPLALQWCLDGLAQGVDRELRWIERVFFYLPLEHAENLEHQERSVQLFRNLLAEVDVAARDAFQGYLDFAVRHRDIIARFGRFPHRNATLGRVSTAEEKEFLTRPGSRF